MADKDVPQLAKDQDRDGRLTEGAEIFVIFVWVLGVIWWSFFASCCLYHICQKIRQKRRVSPAAVVDADPGKPSDHGLHGRELLASPMAMAFVYSSLPLEEKLECGVCEAEVKDGDRIVLLPRCYHGFHKECMDDWFSSRSSHCPACRVDVICRPPDLAV